MNTIYLNPKRVKKDVVLGDILVKTRNGWFRRADSLDEAMSAWGVYLGNNEIQLTSNK